MTVVQQARVWATLARAQSVPLERPDRVLRAFAAMLPYGGTVLGAVAAAKARYPDVAAFEAPSARLTYQDLWDSSTALAHGLSAREGVAQDARLGVLCRNTPLFVQALLAGSMLGADLVFLNTGLAGPQLGEVLASEGIDVVVHDDEFADVVSGLSPSGLDAQRCQELIDEGSKEGLPPPPRQSALVILTSGTTGSPKGAERPSGVSPDGVAALLSRIPMRARDTVVLPAPFFHAWGLGGLLIALSLSCTIVARPEFDPEQSLLDIMKHRESVLLVVPAMLQRMVAVRHGMTASGDFTSLRVIASSGAAIPGRVVSDVLERFGPVLYNVYGSTEVATATIAGPAELLASPGTAGRAALGVRVAILDPENRAVPPGVTGRVAVANSAAFEGYTDGASKESIDGMLLTGDLGHFDKRGRLQLDGREDDMIVSGGENVYPREVEDLLYTHADVAEVAVVGVADDLFGQALKAFVVLREGIDADGEALRSYVRERLATFKVPREVVFMAELPRNATGKVMRRSLV